MGSVGIYICALILTHHGDMLCSLLGEEKAKKTRTVQEKYALGNRPDHKLISAKIPYLTTRQSQVFLDSSMNLTHESSEHALPLRKERRKTAN